MTTKSLSLKYAKGMRDKTLSPLGQTLVLARRSYDASKASCLLALRCQRIPASRGSHHRSPLKWRQLQPESPWKRVGCEVRRQFGIPYLNPTRQRASSSSVETNSTSDRNITSNRDHLDGSGAMHERIPRESPPKAEQQPIGRPTPLSYRSGPGDQLALEREGTLRQIPQSSNQVVHEILSVLDRNRRETGTKHRSQGTMLLLAVS